ncbi:MAG: GreA/GreB family elongation factor [bacterium]
MADDLKSMSDEQLDEWFLGAIAADPLPMPQISDVITHLYATMRNTKADSLAELVQDVLKRRHDIPGNLRIFELQAPWKNDDSPFRTRCRSVLQESYQQPHVGSAYVESAGFDKGDIPTGECLRRLRLIISLSPGVLCLDKTWGFGIVRNLDAFYRKVGIDFDKKRGHELGFEYAAAVLSLLDDNHILVMKHRDPAKLLELVRSNPAEVVRILIRCYGPLNVIQIQERLAPDIVATADWKAFWDGARKVLKSDRFVHFPTGRLEPFYLLHTEKAFDERWFGLLASERSIDTILAKAANLAEDVDAATLSEQARQILLDRLIHVIKGAPSTQIQVVAQGLMMLNRLAIPLDAAIAAPYIERIFSRNGLLSAAAKLPASEFEPLLAYMMAHDRNRASALLLGVLTEATITPLNTLMEFMAANGMEEQSLDVIKRSMAANTLNIEMLTWLSKRIDLLQAKSIGTVADFLTQCVTRLQEPLHGERLKAGKQLRALLERKEWLAPVLGAILPVERERFVMMMRDTSGWAQLEKNAVLARIIGLYPDLHHLLITDDDKNDGGRGVGRYTSWRAYAERRTRLEQIVKVDLPENARDLAVARDYGDLSENHEFKAAKQRQSMLGNQRDTLARELKEVKGTAFEGFACDVAGVGTTVLYTRPDGSKVERYILGEWDTDERQGIISCKTTLAAALIGHKPGDDVTIPSETGTEVCRIVDVDRLPPMIIAWARGSAG